MIEQKRFERNRYLYSSCFTSLRYITTQKVEQPDLVFGIHPGLHAEGVYEFWEPTLELLLDQGVKTAFTVLSEEEYKQVLNALNTWYSLKGKQNGLLNFILTNK